MAFLKNGGMGRGSGGSSSRAAGYGVGGSAPRANGVGRAANPKAKVVDRPLTRGEKKQNSSAETYKTKTTVISPAQAKARAAASERMKRQAQKAKNFNKAVGGTAAGVAGVSYAAGYSDGSKKEKKVSTVSEPNRKRMSDSRRKNAATQNKAKASGSARGQKAAGARYTAMAKKIKK